MDRPSGKKVPLHPCPICGGFGRQTSGYDMTAYFKCESCEQPFSERLLPGGSVEVSFRQRMIRAGESPRQDEEHSNSMYLKSA